MAPSNKQSMLGDNSSLNAVPKSEALHGHLTSSGKITKPTGSRSDMNRATAGKKCRAATKSRSKVHRLITKKGLLSLDSRPDLKTLVKKLGPGPVVTIVAADGVHFYLSPSLCAHSQYLDKAVSSSSRGIILVDFVKRNILEAVLLFLAGSSLLVKDRTQEELNEALYVLGVEFSVQE